MKNCYIEIKKSGVRVKIPRNPIKICRFNRKDTVIKKFSLSSRLRFRRRLDSFNLKNYNMYQLTATIPGKYLLANDEVVRIRRNFLKRLNRPVIWKLEFHKSGQPHWHMYFEIFPGEKRSDIIFHWCDTLDGVIGLHPDTYNDCYAVHDHPEQLKKMHNLSNGKWASYVSTYLCTETKDYQNKTDLYHGRFWGIRLADDLTMYVKNIESISCDKAFRIIEYINFIAPSPVPFVSTQNLRYPTPEHINQILLILGYPIS